MMLPRYCCRWTRRLWPAMHASPVPTTREGSLTSSEARGAAHALLGSVISLPQRPLTRAFWTAEMLRLSRLEHDHPWQMGDLWNAGAVLGHGVRAAIVRSQAWIVAHGARHGTMRNRGAVARRFPQMSRRHDISYAHHEAVMCLKDDAAAHAVLDDAARNGWNDNKTRYEAKRVLHGYHEKFSGDVMTSTADLIARGETYNAIEADCPWRFDASPGVRGTSDTHFPSLSLADLQAIPVPALSRPTCTLFLWAPQCMLEEAYWLMREWGFRNSGSAIVWHKTPGRPGCGYYARMAHEMLLIGVREKAPTWNSDVRSVIEAPRTEHSEKPDVFKPIIERVAPGPRLELFGRRPREGWDVVGDQLPKT
jgi:N6-adenosine-specific RNA methylase IME4